MVTETGAAGRPQVVRLHLFSGRKHPLSAFGEEGLLLQNAISQQRKSIMLGTEKTYVRRAARPTSIRPTAASAHCCKPVITLSQKKCHGNQRGVTFVAPQKGAPGMSMHWASKPLHLDRAFVASSVSARLGLTGNGRCGRSWLSHRVEIGRRCDRSITRGRSLSARRNLSTLRTVR